MNNETNVCHRYLEEMRLAKDEARAHYEHMAESYVYSAEQRTREHLERAQRAQEAAGQLVLRSRQGEEAEARAARELSLRHEEQCSEFAAENMRMRSECSYAQQQCELLAHHVRYLEAAQAQQHAEHLADRRRLENDMATVQDSMQQFMYREQPDDAAEMAQAGSEIGEQMGRFEDDEEDGYEVPNLFEHVNAQNGMELAVAGRREEPPAAPPIPAREAAPADGAPQPQDQG